MSVAHESLPQAEIDHGPDFKHRLAIGSTAVAILIGPPTIGRSHIITTANELYDDAFPAPVATPQSTPIRLVGVVSDPGVWAHHFMTTFSTGSHERREQKEIAIQTLSWMAEQDPAKLHVVYNKIDRPGTATNELYEFLKHDTPLPMADKNRALIEHLLFSAKTIAT